MKRRFFLQAVLTTGLYAVTSQKRASSSSFLAQKIATVLASWQCNNSFFAGLIDINKEGAVIRRQLELPSRAHGFTVLDDGFVIICARRPGDWLVRWHPQTGFEEWGWLDNKTRLNGHVLYHAHTQTVLSTETDIATGQGIIAQRHPETLEILECYPSGGLDPHDILVLPSSLALPPFPRVIPSGSVVVANGGITTLSERGRKKLIDKNPLESNITFLSSDLKQTLHIAKAQDPWLSLRHLAWQPKEQTLGIAMQAEHPDPNAKKNAPIFAIFTASLVQEYPLPGPSFDGYGGSICSDPAGGFWISSPPSQQIIHTKDQQRRHMAAVCPLASLAEGGCVYGGGNLVNSSSLTHAPLELMSEKEHFLLDNHWVIYGF